MPQFKGKFDVIVNSKSEVALRKSDSGKYSAEDAETVHDLIQSTAKARKLGINKYAYFVPAEDKRTGKKYPTSMKRVPVVTVYFGNPQISMLPEQAEGGSTRKRVEIL